MPASSPARGACATATSFQRRRRPADSVLRVTRAATTRLADRSIRASALATDTIWDRATAAAGTLGAAHVRHVQGFNAVRVHRLAGEAVAAPKWVWM